MKKLLVLSLVVVLTLSLAAIASAATFDPYVGGRITWAYMTVSEDQPTFSITNADGSTSTNNLFPATDKSPATYNNSGLKMLLQGKIKDEETGTWATIGAHINNWGSGNTAGLAGGLRDFGINNIGGSKVSVWYTDWENQNMKRGQDRIRGIGVAQYHRDPMFDHAPGNVLGVDYNSDNVVVNFGYSFNKTVMSADKDFNETLAAATFKFDGGDIHVGYYMGQESVAPYSDMIDYRTIFGAENLGTYEMTETAIGMNYKLGFGSLAVDYVARSLGEDGAGNDCELQYGDDDWSGGSQLQAKVSFTDLRLDVTVLLDSKYSFYVDGGNGFEIRYGINDKLYVGYAALSASDEDEADMANMTDMYVGYKYGVFDFRAGIGTKGDGDLQNAKGDDGNNGVTYVSCYASLW